MNSCNLTLAQHHKGTRAIIFGTGEATRRHKKSESGKIATKSITSTKHRFTAAPTLTLARLSWSFIVTKSLVAKPQSNGSVSKSRARLVPFEDC
jgi:hypothetical protein